MWYVKISWYHRRCFFCRKIRVLFLTATTRRYKIAFSCNTRKYELAFSCNIRKCKLAYYYSTILHKRQSLIVFDEVQQFPRARQLIKYFVADGRFDFLETGSLIRLKKNTEHIIIPSEEEHLEMFPMDFEEFLWAMGDEVTVPLIRKCFEQRSPLGQALHRKIMNDFRQYVLVGGMPQSVLAYQNGKDFAASDEAKRRILRLYRDDVAKFAAGYEEKVYAVFDGIPGQLCELLGN